VSVLAIRRLLDTQVKASPGQRLKSSLQPSQMRTGGSLRQV
jgi:hypothetical protein